jgi:serine/threonine-protein kinase HipA
MSQRLQVRLDFGAQSRPLLLGECLWVESERVAAFQWSEAAIQAGFMLSPLMPLAPNAVKARFEPFEGLHGMFSDSIPDGFGLRLMNKGLAAAGYLPDIVNPLHRLAWIGERGIGALTYAPVIDGGESRELIDIAALGIHAARTEEENFQDIPKSAIKAGGSALGARPKFWAAVGDDGKKIILGDSAQTPEGFVPSLLKFAPARGDKNEPFYEAACLLLAQEHGVRAARARLLLHPQGAALAVERFDRLPGGGRIFMQSAAALLNADFRTPCLDYSALAKLSARLSGTPESERIYRQTCFNVALSMRDDHCKNFAFCMDENGKWELSPAFDLCPSAGPAGWHTMTVSGEGQTITRAHLFRFAQSLGLSQAVIDDGIDKALAAADKFESRAIALGATTVGAKKWSKRFKEIGKALAPATVPVGQHQTKPAKRGPGD